MTRLGKSPEDCYLSDVKSGEVEHDASQLVAVRHLQSIFDNLCKSPDRKSLNILSKVPFLKGSTWKPVAGLYLWGSVGRGKTYVVDSFYQCLPFSNKTRLHFHSFMEQTHEKLHSVKNETDPLAIVAAQWARKMRVLCLDEFHVSDIADAMILANLFAGLFKNGVTIIGTSNQAPDMLYAGGLQRARFLPAIDLIEQKCKVINVDGGTDYRLRALEKAPLYCYPLNEQSAADIADIFHRLVPVEGEIKTDVNLEVEGRSIPVIKLSEDIVWFNFASVCEGPRSQNDYIDIACEFHAVIISDVPVMGAANDDAARRFVNLVDEFYDRNVKLAISAAEPLQTLYSGGRLSFEFERTQSRLLEMQSHEYLARPHRP